MARSEYGRGHMYRGRFLTVVQDNGAKCSIFTFDIGANKARLPLAKNALRKLKTLRHPGVVKVLDTVEVGMTKRRKRGTRC